MSFTDDNAVGFDTTLISTDPAESTELEHADAVLEIINSLKGFAALSQRYTESCNEVDREFILAEKKKYLTLMDEKFQLLCDLNIPHTLNSTAATLIDNVQKKEIKRCGNIFAESDKYARAYEEYCRSAIKKAEASVIKESTDEFTNMPYIELEQLINEMKNKEESVQKAFEEQREKYNLRVQENQEKLSAILKETEDIEKFELEAIEVAKEFELKSTPRSLMKEKY